MKYLITIRGPIPSDIVKTLAEAQATAISTALGMEASVDLAQRGCSQNGGSPVNQRAERDVEPCENDDVLGYQE